MSKDLQAIKYLNDTCINFLDRTKELYCTVTFTRKRAEILRDNIAEVEQALQRLEAIEKGKNTDIIDNYMAFKNDNAEPSEALVCLLSIYSFSEDVIYQFEKEYNTVRQALLKAQDNARSEEILQKYYQEGITLDSVRALKEKNAEYKDLEEEIGCPLDVAFKALKNGIYVAEGTFEKYDVRGIELRGLSVISKICSYAECDFICYYTDYKKTWWLKEDKSE